MNIEFYPAIDNNQEFPPVPVKKAIPDWYKNLPTEFAPFTAKWFSGTDMHTNATIKQCVPVLDYLTSGYLIRNQADTLISVEENADEQGFFWRSAASASNTVMFHPHSQCPIKIEGQRKTYIKLRGHYIIKTPPGYSCLFYQSEYSMNDKFRLFPAIVDTDNFDAEILFPGYLLKGAGNFMLEAGAPIMTVFPFKRDEWAHKVHTEPMDIKNNELNKKRRIFLTKIYKNFFHSPKEYK